MNFLIKIFLVFVILLAQNLFSRTRQQVIDEANEYKNYSWKVGINNILDIKNNRTGAEGSDGIDDRRGNPNILSEAQMNQNWPFATNQIYTGEAYAWGYGHYAKPDMKPPDDVLKKWDANQTKSFEEYLRLGRIAGAKKGNPGLYVTKNGVSSEDLGLSEKYTGLDCSGFITRVWGLKDYHLESGKLKEPDNKAVAMWIPITELKQGDMIYLKGDDVDHVVIFNYWKEKPKTAHIIHSASYSFSKNKHMRRVIEDIAEIDSSKQQIYFKGEWRECGAYTPFPVFKLISPDLNVDVATPVIKIKIKSFSKIINKSIRLKVDGKIVPAEYSTKENEREITLTYIPIEPLANKEHTVRIYAINEFGFEDEEEFKFTVNKDDLKVEMYIEKIDFIQGKNKWRYVWGKDSAGDMRLMKYYYYKDKWNVLKENEPPFSFNSSEDIEVGVLFSKGIKKDTAPKIYFYEKDKKLGLKLKNEDGSVNDYIYLSPDWTEWLEVYKEKWNGKILKQDLADTTSGNVNLWEKVNNCQVIACSYDNKTITIAQPLKYDVKASKRKEHQVKSEKSYVVNSKIIDGNTVFLIKDRIIKVEVIFDEEGINYFEPAKVEIAGFKATAITDEGYVNGWKQLNETNWQWTGIIDFGTNWREMENKYYPVYIEASDLAGNVGKDTNQKIGYDTKNPTFEFLDDLSKLSFNILDNTDLGKFSFKLWDNLSEKLKVHLALKKDDGENLLGFDFTLQIRPNFKIEPISANISDYIEVNTNGNLIFKWDGKDIFGMLQTALQKPQIQIVIEDEAGNVFNSSQFHFDLKQVIPEPTELLKQCFNQIKDRANKIVFVDSSVLPTWSWQAVQDKLSEKGIDFRVCQLRGGDKWEDLDKQVAEIKKTIDDFVRGNEKCILFGFGSGGVAEVDKKDCIS
jgi:hypothetical protein